jgi:hypothetical protein
MSRPADREATSPADLRSVGGGARRAIPWDELDAGALGDRGRQVVGAGWRERMRQEHLAVGAFSLLAQELAAEGCDPIVLSLITRASSDEVRHAEICRRFAVQLLGEEAVPSRVKGLPNVPMHPEASGEVRTLLHVVEMCCLSETLTGVFLTEMLARTTDPTARTAVESLLEDEVDHGRVGWAYVTERARGKALDGLSAALPAMIDRTFRPVMSAAAKAPEDEGALEACAHLGMRAAAGICGDTLRDVVLPGFEAAGVDLRATRKLVSDRRWV